MRGRVRLIAVLVVRFVVRGMDRAKCSGRTSCDIILLAFGEGSPFCYDVGLPVGDFIYIRLSSLDQEGGLALSLPS